MDWDREIAVVTGGANGIGKEMVVLLAEKTKHPVAVLDLAPMSYSHPSQSAIPVPQGSARRLTIRLLSYILNIKCNFLPPCRRRPILQNRCRR